MVNCLVVKPMVIVPKPFGPKDASGKDVFEEYAKKKLNSLGLDFKPVDDWDDYHVAMGEIHCGTNTKRIPPKDWEWWKEK
jgi:protein-arginine deiminase